MLVIGEGGSLLVRRGTCSTLNLDTPVCFCFRNGATSPICPGLNKGELVFKRPHSQSGSASVELHLCIKLSVDCSGRAKPLSKPHAGMPREGKVFQNHPSLFALRDLAAVWGRNLYRFRTL